MVVVVVVVATYGIPASSWLFSDGIWDKIIVDSETCLSQLYEQKGTTFNVMSSFHVIYIGLTLQNHE